MELLYLAKYEFLKVGLKVLIPTAKAYVCLSAFFHINPL